MHVKHTHTQKKTDSGSRRYETEVQSKSAYHTSVHYT